MQENTGKYKRTRYCAYVSEKEIGREVVVCGWVNGKRDMGNLIFLNVRDRSGVIQLVFDKNTKKEVFE